MSEPASEPKAQLVKLRRLLPWVLLAAVLVGALVVGTRGEGGPPTRAERAADIASSVRCPQCAGQSVQDSDAPVAVAIRSEIGRQLAEGRSDDEIRDDVVSQYGEGFLLNPPRSGVAGLVWVLPVAALVAALAALALLLRRWRAAPGTAVSDEDRALVARARSEATAAGEW